MSMPISDLQPGVELSHASQSDYPLDLAEEGRLSATPLLQTPDRPARRGSRPRANATYDEFGGLVSRESSTSTEAIVLLAVESDGSALVDVDSAAGGLGEDDFVDPSQLPTLAMRLLGRSFPETVLAWPADATIYVWRLQHLAVCILALLALGFLVVLVALVRGLEAWQSSAGQPCKPPLRWWLIGHVSILVLGIMGCCSGMAFLGLAGWIAWGTALLQRRQTKKCPSELIQAVQESMSVELILFGLVLLIVCLAGCAARVVRKIHALCHSHYSPWDPEAHLEFEDPPPSTRLDGCKEHEAERTALESSDRRELACDRECVICCDSLAGSEVIARARCGHRFHKDCVLEWLRNHRTCPLCRQRLDKPIGWRDISPIRAALRRV